ncbi:MAG TPA: winged helix-turn-helix domain-containing protein [Pyrinomonadaceae bacterium]|jgi:DNA-binding winged helix-turn-helix (wHTH) protein
MYLFGSFRLDTSRRVLLHEGVEVALTPKAYEMLVVLVESSGSVVTKEELKRRLWPDSVVEDSNITVQKRALTVALGEGYIQTVPRVGYRFTAEVRRGPLESDEVTHTSPPNGDSGQGSAPRIVPVHTPDAAAGATSVADAQPPRVSWVWLVVAGLAGVVLTVGAFAAILRWRGAAQRANVLKEREVVHAPTDEAEVMRVVKESQLYETLGIYGDPSSYDAGRLRHYWLPTEEGGKEVAKIEASVKRLLEKGVHYGKDSRVERFEFRSVRVYSPRDYAEAGTIERWYVPLRRADETLVEGRNIYLGPYTVDYTLRKVNGQWLLEESSTPRASN